MVTECAVQVGGRSKIGAKEFLKAHVLDEIGAEVPDLEMASLVPEDDIQQKRTKKAVATGDLIKALDLHHTNNRKNEEVENQRVHGVNLGEIEAGVLGHQIEGRGLINDIQLQTIGVEVVPMVQLYHRSRTQAIEVNEAIAAQQVQALVVVRGVTTLTRVVLCTQKKAVVMLERTDQRYRQHTKLLVI